ncbi:unnamed protein product [Moneuplotes crassus]|uniref:B box-type domain-containing protein n=1 Tax=Euplotes crassus TaxID=5936 RepID=A0AAD1YBD0_EUPCR|nr:unnamed protein product [Moneuplotes crassus]
MNLSNSIVSDIQELDKITCQVCNQTDLSSTLFACNLCYKGTFCHECAHKMEQKSLDCPKCLKKIDRKMVFETPKDFAAIANLRNKLDRYGACDTHNMSVGDMYCSNCDIGICEYCIIDGAHREHSIVSLSSHLDILKKEALLQYSKLKISSDRSKRVLSSVVILLDMIKYKLNGRVDQHIKKVSDIVNQKLRCIANGLISVYFNYNSHSEQLEHDKDTYQTHLQDLDFYLKRKFDKNNHSNLRAEVNFIREAKICENEYVKKEYNQDATLKSIKQDISNEAENCEETIGVIFYEISEKIHDLLEKFEVSETSRECDSDSQSEIFNQDWGASDNTRETEEEELHSKNPIDLLNEEPEVSIKVDENAESAEDTKVIESTEPVKEYIPIGDDENMPKLLTPTKELEIVSCDEEQNKMESAPVENDKPTASAAPTVKPYSFRWEDYQDPSSEEEYDEDTSSQEEDNSHDGCSDTEEMLITHQKKLKRHHLKVMRYSLQNLIIMTSYILQRGEEMNHLASFKKKINIQLMTIAKRITKKMSPEHLKLKEIFGKIANLKQNNSLSSKVPDENPTNIEVTNDLSQKAQNESSLEDEEAKLEQKEQLADISSRVAKFVKNIYAYDDLYCRKEQQQKLPEDVQKDEAELIALREIEDVSCSHIVLDEESESEKKMKQQEDQKEETTVVENNLKLSSSVYSRCNGSDSKDDDEASNPPPEQVYDSEESSD